MSLRRLVARVPGAITVTRVVRNQYHGVRQRLHFEYDVDGTTHRRMTSDESVEYVGRVVADYLAFGGIQARDVSDRTVLEIGPGDSLGVALTMVGLGARRVVAADRFRTFRIPATERRILSKLVQDADPSARELMRRCLGEDGLVNGGPIEYRPETPIEALAADAALEPFDYIVSRSVLEHVFDLDGTYRSCRRLIRDGGLMIHKVDLSNHSTVESHPLQFLTHSERWWRLMSSNISRVNRSRWPHHRAALERNGFAIERFGVTKRLPLEAIGAIRPRLAPEFRGLADEELAIYGFFMACRAV